MENDNYDKWQFPPTQYSNTCLKKTTTATKKKLKRLFSWTITVSITFLGQYLQIFEYWGLSIGYEKSILFQGFDCYSSTFALNVIRFRDIDLEWNRDHYCSESGRFNFFFVAVVFFFEATVRRNCQFLWFDSYLNVFAIK